MNTLGLDFYDRLVDELLGHEIAPFVTLYHWDLPQPLEDRGGWPVRDTADCLRGVHRGRGRRLGDRVHHWITLNEPWVVSVAWLRDRAARPRAHERGRCRGGRAPPPAGTRPRRGGAAPRRSGRGVGITIDVVPMHPLTASEADANAARQEDALRNRWFLDPVFRGDYPAEAFGATGHAARRPSPPRTCARSRRRLDFVGINYYQRAGRPGDPRDGDPAVVSLEGVERTGMGWEVYPDGLHELLVRLHDTYDVPPIYITENGAAYPDTRRRRFACPTRSARRTSSGTSKPSPARSETACRSPATSSGRSSTTSSGRADTRSGSESSMWTSRRSSGFRSRATARIATSSQPNGLASLAPSSRERQERTKSSTCERCPCARQTTVSAAP